MNELYKTVYGSHLYGTSTPKSDYDYKVIFLPEFRDVLLGKQLKTKQASTSNDKTKNTEDDVDVQYVPLQTFAKDYFDGQTYAYEVAHFFLYSQTNVASVSNANFLPFVSELVEQFTNSDVKSMVGYAWSQAEKYALKGKRQRTLEQFKTFVFYVMKNYLKKDMNLSDVRVRDVYDAIPPQAFDKFEQFAPYVKLSTIEQTTAEGPMTFLVLQVLNKSVLFTVRVQELLARVDDLLSQYGHRVKEAAKLSEEQVDWKSLYHALRITLQTNDLLTTGKIELPFKGDRLQLLMNVRNGVLAFDECKSLFEAEMDKLDDNLETTKLRPKTEKLAEEFQDFLFKWLKTFYNL